MSTAPRAAEAAPAPVLIPAALRPGSRVALIAPASPYDPEQARRGRELLSRWGLEPVRLASHRPPGRLTAGSVRQRVAEIHEAFADPGIEALIAMRGGYGCLQLLPHLDWALLRAHPKLLVGLSDVSALLWSALDRATLVGLHGPMVVSLGKEPDPASVERLWQALSEPEPLPPLQAAGHVERWCLSPGRARGTVIGGNLATLLSLLGTPYAPRTEGRILLLEEVGEPPYRIHRMLTQLRLSGMLDRCAGLGLGEMLGCEPPAGVGYELRDVLRDALADLPLPVIWGLPFGHGATNEAFPVGVRASLDAHAGCLCLEQAGTAAARTHDHEATERPS